MQSDQLKSNLIERTAHFEILDGLRGIAALIVVIFHFTEIVITDYNNNFFSHGYLAVDFFFCLSGFVIAHAYDQRVPTMSLKTFIIIRLIRLQPLVIIGSVLGLLTFLFDPYSNFYTVYGVKETVLIFITSIFLVPHPIMPERFFNLFSLNAPTWSLFWEYIANLEYIVILFKASNKVLILFLLFAGAAVFYVGFQSGNLSGGWGGNNFIDGLTRVSFSFIMGMLINRSNWIIKNKLGLLGMSSLLLLAFLSPYNDKWNWLIEAILVIFYLPLIVSLGAGTILSSNYYKINKFFGDVSYPLYMTHYPFVWIFLTYVAAKKPSMDYLRQIIPISIFLLIVLSYLVYKFLDFPIRNYLNDKLKAGAKN